MKQTVLIVHNYYQIPGGEDTVVENEKKMLEENGHKVVLYTRHNDELNNLSKLKKIMLPISTVFSIKTYREVKKLIRVEKIDVVHVHNTLNMVSPSVYYAAFASKIPVVQTIHNFRLLCPGATFFRAGKVCEDCLKKGLMCAVKYKCYRGSRVQTLACVISTYFHRFIGTYKKLNYICLTEFNREKLLNLKHIKKNRVFVKPNFVQAEKEFIPYQERKEQMIYVGRLEEIKGVEILLKAWKLLGDDAPELLICGKGPLESWCNDYIEKNQLSKVKMLGFVPNDQVRTWISQSKALILPTQVYEGFPMTIAEAYACGTPVIGSDLGNTASLIENEKSGWKFEHTSERALADRVLIAKNYTSGIDNSYISKYSKEANYRQLREIYEKCCNYH